MAEDIYMPCGCVIVRESDGIDVVFRSPDVCIAIGPVAAMFLNQERVIAELIKKHRHEKAT